MIIKDKIAFFDVETPNRNNNSICSIGIVYEDENGNTKEFYSLVNPECAFDTVNTNIHGIISANVSDAPTFPELWKTISRFFSEYLVIGHNVKFDLSCIKKALKSHGIDAPNPFYVDTLEIARSYITETENHKLETLCHQFGIDLLRLHNALEDTKATADLFQYLIKRFDIDLNLFIKQYDFSDIDIKARTNHLGYTDNTKYLQELQGIVFGIMCDEVLTDAEITALKYWTDTHQALKRNYPFDRIYAALQRVLEDGIITEAERNELYGIFRSALNPMESETPYIVSSDLSGKAICLTGDFAAMSRKEMEQFLIAQGAVIKNSISKKLDYLIVGDLGSIMWIQGNYGTKIKKAMEYNEKGADITIIQEKDFMTVFDF